MGRDYHQPFFFLARLNSAIQALRNITWKLQSEKSKISDFQAWYDGVQATMRRDPILRSFCEARNVVVKQEGLESKSNFRSGLFRGRRMKLGFGPNLPLMTESATELRRLRASSFAKLILGSDRSAIGEQLGVERRWIVEKLGEEEVLSLCILTLNKLGEVVSRAHARCDSNYCCDHILCDEYDKQNFQVLLETDLDPSLSKKWGWDEAVESLPWLFNRAP